MEGRLARIGLRIWVAGVLLSVAVSALVALVLGTTAKEQQVLRSRLTALIPRRRTAA